MGSCACGQRANGLDRPIDAVDRVIGLQRCVVLGRIAELPESLGLRKHGCQSLWIGPL